jgi:hypothetical protein
MAVEITSRGANSVGYAALEDGKIILGEQANVEPNLDRVQRMRQAEINNQTLGRCSYSIPLVELAAWCNKLGLSLEEATSNDAILDRFIADGHQRFAVHKGWA